MKVFFASILGLLFLFDATFAAHRSQSKNVHLIEVPRPGKGIDFCKGCVDFTDNAIEDMIEIILNAGVLGTCQTLCNALATKTGSQALGAVCDILCSIVGVEEFVKFIEKADLDSFYFCELLSVCKINDHGDATITKFEITPASAPRGSTFTMNIEYTSKNGTGPGQIELDIDTLDGIPVGGDFFHDNQPTGTYSLSVQLKTDNSGCDPEGPCEEWKPGNYTAHLYVCNGECGSKHPHSQLYATTQAEFHIVHKK